MTQFLKYGLFLLLALAVAIAEAMPIGVRIAISGRAAAQEAVNAVFPALDGEVSAADVAEALAERRTLRLLRISQMRRDMRSSANGRNVQERLT